MLEGLQLSIIIPTKNRADSLATAVQSILSQTVAPQTLLIVDQSPDETGLRLVKHLFNGRASPCLRYIHDPSIAGASTARNRAMREADGDIWLFLDDDVVLEPDFIKHLLLAYHEDPTAIGVSGVITNYPHPSAFFRLWTELFVRGKFRDPRQPVYWRADVLRDARPVITDRFTGAVMSFRADSLQGVSFDDHLDLHLKGISDGEDVDVCYRLARGSKLLITPRARLAHNHDPAGRLKDHWLRRHSRANIFLYKKHWDKGVANRVAYGWLWIGYTISALAAAVRRVSFEPLRALLYGRREALLAFRTSRRVGTCG